MSAIHHAKTTWRAWHYVHNIVATYGLFEAVRQVWEIISLHLFRTHGG